MALNIINNDGVTCSVLHQQIYGELRQNAIGVGYWHRNDGTNVGIRSRFTFTVARQCSKLTATLVYTRGLANYSTKPFFVGVSEEAGAWTSAATQEIYFDSDKTVTFTVERQAGDYFQPDVTYYLYLRTDHTGVLASLGCSSTGNNYGDLTATFSVDSLGLAYIDDGTALQPCTVWIDTGTDWVQVIPHVDDGTAWAICT